MGPTGEGRPPSLRDWLCADIAPTSDLAVWSGGLRNDSSLPTVAEPLYTSADSAPRGFAVRRGWWVAPLFLASLAAASAGIAWRAGDLARLYGHALSRLTGVDPGWVAPAGASISIRPFVFLFFLLLPIFSTGTAAAKARFVTGAWAMYAGIILLADAGFVLARHLGAPSPLSTPGGIVAILGALAVGVYVVFTQYELPIGVRVATVRKRPGSYATTFLSVLGLVGCAVLVLHVARGYLEAGTLRSVAALATATAILVIGTQLVLFLIATRRRPRAVPGFAPSVAFLIPAHNERGSIGATIAAIDAAASSYDGTCTIYFVDNGSVDGTAEAATEALSRCKALAGNVLRCTTKGKAHALNYGLAQTSEEIVVRVDSDTIVKPTLLNDVTPYFCDQEIGGVSGIPLPRPDGPRWLAPFWLMEVYHTIGFVRVAQNTIDGALVLPGSMSVYRGDVVRKLGGFAVGHNGEDGDMAVRIGRLGYRLVTDPRLEFFTEIPATMGHLMEQRLRWSRGGFNKFARNKSSFVLRQGFRGLLVLPWATLSGCRRAFSAPMFVAVGAASAVDPSLFTLREVAVIGGTGVGANLLLIGVLLVVRRRPLVLLFLPGYLAFRVFKLYAAFVALLTLELRGSDREPAGVVDWSVEPLPGSIG